MYSVSSIDQTVLLEQHCDETQSYYQKLWTQILFNNIIHLLGWKKMTVVFTCYINHPAENYAS